MNIAQACSYTLGYASPFGEDRCSTFDELLLAIERDYQKLEPWIDGTLSAKPILANLPLMPLLEIAKFSTKQLGLDEKQTTWMVCLDEAEFLPEAFIKVLNTVLRSEKRPFSVKIATLPFHYTTHQTLIHGEQVSPGGNDFNYVSLDYEPETQEFIDLANHMLQKRLASQFDSKGLPGSIEQIVETLGDGDLTSIYRFVSNQSAGEDTDLTDLTLRHLSPQRRIALKDKTKLSSNGTIKRYRPIALLRELRKIDTDGGTISCVLSGGRQIRLLSDGNPRVLLQIFSALLETGREQELTAKSQHRAITIFCRRRMSFVPAVSTQGFVLNRIVTALGNLISHRTHDDYAVDCGRSFKVSIPLLRTRGVQTALTDGVAAGYLQCDFMEDTVAISSETVIKLSASIAGHFWIPLRTGQPVTISTKQLSLEFLEAETVTETESKQIELELGDLPSEGKDHE